MSAPILVCFAVKEEARFFLEPFLQKRCVRLITGMGQRNAAASIRKALSEMRPSLVITAGFAGGLNPDLPAGKVVFNEDSEAGLSGRLLEFGAVAGKFYCSERVVVTIAEKKSLWQSTGADVVEMESSVIRQICREQNIPSATVRVISDSAQEDLPLDFNVLMTPAERINYAKLAWTIITHPGKIPQLMKFNQQTIFAARQLAAALGKSLARG